MIFFIDKYSDFTFGFKLGHSRAEFIIEFNDTEITFPFKKYEVPCRQFMDLMNRTDEFIRLD